MPYRDEGDEEEITERCHSSESWNPEVGKRRETVTEKRVSKHFRDEEKEFKEYFPLFTYNNALGAYDFLCQRGYQQQSDYIAEFLRIIIYKYRDGKESEPRKIRTGNRRSLVVGFIFEKGLIDNFLKEVWTKKHATLEYRIERMEKWYEEYNARYKPRYGYINESSK